MAGLVDSAEVAESVRPPVKNTGVVGYDSIHMECAEVVAADTIYIKVYAQVSRDQDLVAQ